MKKANSYQIILVGKETLSEDAVREVKGVSSLQHDPQEGTLLVTIDERRIDDAAEILQEVVERIRQAGGEVRTEKATHPVLHMTCAACASSSQNILSFVPGVLNASVNYGNGKGQIEYLPGIATPDAMKQALQEMGYDLLTEEEESSLEKVEELQKENYRTLRRHTILAIALAIPLVVIGMFFMHAPFANIAMWLLATPILFLFGRRFFVGAWKQARHRSANMDTLVALSTGIAYLFTVAAMIVPYLVLDNPYVSLAVMLTIVVVIILLFTYYISVAKDLPFGKRFGEMAVISLGVAAISFGIGILVKRFLGIDI